MSFTERKTNFNFCAPIHKFNCSHINEITLASLTLPSALFVGRVFDTCRTFSKFLMLIFRFSWLSARPQSFFVKGAYVVTNVFNVFD